MNTTFYGLPTETIENEQLRVDYLTTAGPRIVRLSLAGSRVNLLAETPNTSWETPYGPFHLYGGHRLWCAPELFPESSYPDDQPVAIEKLPNGVRLQAPPEAISGITKSVEICLDPAKPALTVVHRLQNDGDTTHQVAPWGITELPLGGVAFLPEHTNADSLGPNRQLALWSYSHWKDARLELRDDCIRVHATIFPAAARMSPLKVGYFDSCGWLGYLHKSVLFVKHFDALPETPYPDLNCNAEVYVNDQYIELETLAPMTRLEPGQSVTHRERWQVFTDVHDWREVQALVN